MKTQLVLVLGLLFSFSSFGQTFKVTKIQGQKAIVEVDDPDLIEVNKSYSTITSVINSNDKDSKKNYKRDYGIDTALNYQSLKSDVAGGGITTTTTAIDFMFLWNMKRYEYGPILSYSGTDNGTTQSNSTNYGIAGYYNINENKISLNKMLSIYGAFLTGSLTGTVSGTTTVLKVGPTYRWFALSGDHCLSMKILYVVDKRPSAANIDVTSSGPQLEFGIGTYF